MRIGISVLTHAGQNIWENGMGQNVLFLARLLQRIEFVESVTLIDAGDQQAMPPQVDTAAMGLGFGRARDLTGALDVVIEMAGALDVQWLQYFRACGGRVAFHCVGQPFVALAEPIVFSDKGHFSRPDRCDEVWLLPKDEVFTPMMRTLHRCPVFEVPYLWSPQFLAQRVAEVEAAGLPLRLHAAHGRSSRVFSVAVFEPNISVVKSSSVPMLVCDAAYRADPACGENRCRCSTRCTSRTTRPCCTWRTRWTSCASTRRCSTAATTSRASWCSSPTRWSRTSGRTTRTTATSTRCTATTRWCTTRRGCATPATTTPTSTLPLARGSCCRPCAATTRSSTNYRARAQPGVRCGRSVQPREHRRLCAAAAAPGGRQRRVPRRRRQGRMSDTQRTPMPARLKVGVSIFIRKGEQSLWENGVYQNCLFLVMLLLRSPRVQSAVLVAGGGDGGPADATSFLADSPVPVIDMATAGQELDLMIEMSAQLAREWSLAFRERGGKIVSMRVGNDYVIDIERMIFDKPHGLLISGAPYDEVWTIPEYEVSCKPYFESTFRAPVRLVPHLWSPMVLERAMARVPLSARPTARPSPTCPAASSGAWPSSSPTSAW
jgi:hypothetical protein